MRTIYHKPHSARRSEAAFVQSLLQKFPDATYRTEDYPIAEHFLHKYVQTQSLLTALKHDQHLPTKQRELCSAILAMCPPQLQVAHNPKRTSFDVVVVADDKPYYWEYHEHQHRRLSVARPQQVYDATTGAALTVPRYVQRFVRDIWRLQHFRPYTIVWRDWFEQQGHTYQPQLQPGLHEYGLPSKFSFQSFYAQYLRES